MKDYKQQKHYEELTKRQEEIAEKDKKANKLTKRLVKKRQQKEGQHNYYYHTRQNGLRRITVNIRSCPLTNP